MKKIRFMGILIILCIITGCGLQSETADLPDTPLNESSHNSSAGLTATMPEHEAATTDPAYFEKYGDKETADEVRSKTDKGSDKVNSTFNQKNDTAVRRMNETKHKYDEAEQRGDFNGAEKSQKAQEKLDELYDTSKHNLDDEIERSEEKSKKELEEYKNDAETSEK